MEQMRCQKCYRRLFDIESKAFKIRIRCRHCKIWCSFSKGSSADEREHESVISNAGSI